MVGRHVSGRREDFVKFLQRSPTQVGLSQAEPLTVENRDNHHLIGLCLIDALAGNFPASQIGFVRPECEHLLFLCCNAMAIDNCRDRTYREGMAS
jgi:hypothetical protein